MGAEIRAYPDHFFDDYAVAFKYGTKGEVEAPRLARKYNFRIQTQIFTVGFLAALDPKTVAALRCESSVQSVQFGHTLTPLP